MKKWGIIRVVGELGVLKADGTFSANVIDAKLFETQAEAQAVAITLKSTTLVQQLTIPSVPGRPARLNFPGPLDDV